MYPPVPFFDACHRQSPSPISSSKNVSNTEGPHGCVEPCGPSIYSEVSVPKRNYPGSRRQKQPFVRQHFLKRWPEPQGQRSFLPSFSSSNLSPWTTRSPRLTCVSDGNPLRRLLIVSKKWLFVELFVVCLSHGTPPVWLELRPRTQALR